MAQDISAKKRCSINNVEQEATPLPGGHPLSESAFSQTLEFNARGDSINVIPLVNLHIKGYARGSKFKTL